MSRSLLFAVFFLVSPLLLNAGEWKVPDFGNDGLSGLDISQKRELAEGRIVFSTTDQSKDSSLIEAAIVFNKRPEEVWGMISKTEDQIKYLKEIDQLKVVKKDEEKDAIWFKLKIAFIPISYQVNHSFVKERQYFFWSLDPSYKNDLKDLKGFWKFYPYGPDKTLARYGSLVSLKYVPAWLQDQFKKSGVEKALKAVKCYVDSGGTCKRKGY